MAEKREGLKAWANIFAPVIGAGVLGAAGLIIQSRIAGDANAREYVQLGLTVLREAPDPDNKAQASLRLWAVEVVDKYAPIKLGEEARDELLRKQFGLSPAAWERAKRGEDCAGSLLITGDSVEYDRCMTAATVKALDRQSEELDLRNRQLERHNEALQQLEKRINEEMPDRRPKKGS